MARPKYAPTEISPQLRGWDAQVNNNGDQLKTILHQTPFAPVLVHRSTPNGDSVVYTTFPASDHQWCYAHLVDPASPSTNGYLIYSDGSSWRYVKSNSVVS